MDSQSRREWIVATTLILCVLLVGFWQVMAKRSSRPHQPFELTAEDFSGLRLASDAWYARPLPIGSDPIEPNIAAYACEPLARDVSARASAQAFVVRLVHGYNMPDCMRLKRYTVELIGDTGGDSRDAALNARQPATSNQQPTTTAPGAGRIQTWRLRSSVGDTSIWVTSMLRAGDFAETQVDVRSMAFPRINMPDDPGWLPRGITWRSLRNPVRSVRRIVRTKWNDSRRDLATFLRLKQPAWASEELLTLVAASPAGLAGPEDEAWAAERVLAVHRFAYAGLRSWRVAQTQQDAPR